MQESNRPSSSPVASLVVDQAVEMVEHNLPFASQIPEQNEISREGSEPRAISRIPLMNASNEREEEEDSLDAYLASWSSSWKERISYMVRH